MLGPAEQTYKGSRRVLVILLLLAAATAIIAQLALQSTEENEGYSQSIPWVLMIPFASVAAWLMSLQLGIHSEGISYQSLFGTREMRWDEVEKLYYSSLAYSINFIPAGTYYLFSLLDGNGNRLSFGNRLERPAEIGEQLVQRTYPFIFQKLAEQFNSGMELDFGTIRIRRERGIARKRLLGWKWLRWEEVVDYAIDKGNFFLWPVGKKYVTGVQLGRIPNAFVLLGLLDDLSGRTTPPAASTE